MARRSRRITALALVLMATVVWWGRHTQAAPQEATGTTGQQSRDWKRVTAGDLTVVGNVSADDLGRALLALEDFRSALLLVFPRLQLGSDVPNVVIVFRGDRSFRRFKTRDDRGRIRDEVAGYFGREPDMNVMVMGWGATREAALEILFHEYTHYVINRNLPTIPAWLNEGLAEFYATFRSDYRDGRSLIGAPPGGRLRTLASGQALIPIRDMLSSSSAARLLRDPTRVGMFYAQAWALVHYLYTRAAESGSEAAIDFRAFEGGPIEDSVRLAFGMDLGKLERELAAYVRQRRFAAALLPKRPERPGPVPAAAPMLELEARFIQGDLLSRLGASDEAEKELERVLSSDANHLGARIAMSRVRISQEREADAIVMLEAAVASAPTNFAAHYYLAAARAAADQHQAALESYARALALQPRSAAAWYGRCTSAMALDRQADAEAALTELLAIDPDPVWLRGLAYGAYEVGAYAALVRTADRFLTAKGLGDESAPYMALMSAVGSLHLGRAADAGVRLADAVAVHPPDTWPGRLVRFMSGELDAETLVARARDDGERTEAHGYAGVKAIIDGRFDEARKHLQWVKDRGRRDFVEYGMALADLKRLIAIK